MRVAESLSFAFGAFARIFCKRQHPETSLERGKVWDMVG
jgi:hypothetical protein